MTMQGFGTIGNKHFEMQGVVSGKETNEKPPYDLLLLLANQARVLSLKP